MPIVTICPHCGQRYNVQADAVGEKTSCMKCGQQFIISKTPQGGTSLSLGMGTTSVGGNLTPMSKVVINCPFCQSFYECGASVLETQVTCPKCHNSFVAKAFKNGYISSPRKHSKVHIIIIGLIIIAVTLIILSNINATQREQAFHYDQLKQKFDRELKQREFEREYPWATPEGLQQLRGY